jgi:hypothetical protein
MPNTEQTERIRSFLLFLSFFFFLFLPRTQQTKCDHLCSAVIVPRHGVDECRERNLLVLAVALWTSESIGKCTYCRYGHATRHWALIRLEQKAAVQLVLGIYGTLYPSRSIRSHMTRADDGP